MFLLLLTSFVFAAEGDWSLVTTTKDGIKSEKREVPGSPLMAFRGEAVVDAPLTKVATVIFDTKRAPEWIVDLEECKLIKWTSSDEYIEYDHVKTPPIIMKDRDFVSTVKLTLDAATKTIKFYYRSVEAPEVPRTKFVRGELMNTTFILKSIENDSKTQVLGEVHADPKGSVPKWIVNFFQSDWPIDTIRNLRKQVLKADIKDEPRIVEMMKTQANKNSPTTPPST